MTYTSSIQIIGIKGLPIINPEEDIGKLICEAASEQGIYIQDGDILVVTHKIVSRAEGRIIDLKEVSPSAFAESLARRINKEPKLVEVILRESKSIRRIGHGTIIAETHHGWICANAGVDKSNVPGKDSVVALPKNPDRSAQCIRSKIKQLTGKDVAVIISDTSGRPFRSGTIDVAIGCAGIDPIYDRRGEKDLFGYTLRVKQTAIVDELASAAELVIGQAAEAVPVAIIRGYKYRWNEKARATKLIRPKRKDLFI